MAESKHLQLTGVIGFNGQVRKGFILHPDDKHVVYPLGSTIVVRNLLKNNQHFLHKDGHDQNVSCLAISSSGKYLASGQETHMGFLATVIVWNLETCEIVHKLKLHKGKIQDVCFSHDEQYLATLGGIDDNRVVVWEVESGAAICGAPAHNETATTVRFFNNDAYSLVTGGKYNLRVWNFEQGSRKLTPIDVNLGSLKRHINAIEIDENDEFLYAGTHSGDLLKVNIQHKVYKLAGPTKKPFSQGVQAVARTRKGNLVVGSGSGTIAILHKDTLRVMKEGKVSGGVTSIQLNAAGDHFFVGTRECNTYLVHLQSFEMELRSTCHFGGINDIAFPANYSELFATASVADIRVWHAKNRSELLRIHVPNLVCNCITFSHDGKAIISGWDDGKIRAFKPQSGKLIYEINDAHVGGVTAIAGTSDSQTLISGGKDGQVRIWEVTARTQRMIVSLKEHKGPVNVIRLNEDDTEAVTSSDDGSCIIWSLEGQSRINTLFASNQFKSVAYHPDQSQFVTTGTDRKITYWDAVDANPIRVMDGSQAEITTLTVARDGESFVSAGADKIVRVWGYDEGSCQFKGVGHSGTIERVEISPDQQTIVSVGNEGAIFIWSMPEVEPASSGSNEVVATNDVAKAIGNEAEGGAIYA